MLFMQYIYHNYNTSIKPCIPIITIYFCHLCVIQLQQGYMTITKVLCSLILININVTDKEGSTLNLWPMEAYKLIKDCIEIITGGGGRVFFWGGEEQILPFFRRGDTQALPILRWDMYIFSQTLIIKNLK